MARSTVTSTAVHVTSSVVKGTADVVTGSSDDDKKKKSDDDKSPGDALHAILNVRAPQRAGKSR